MTKDGCRACHVAHASDQKNLLVPEETKLCAKCHAAGAGGFKKAHGDYPVASRAARPATIRTRPRGRSCCGRRCTSRSAGGCDSCHADKGSSKPFAVSEKGGKLCANCHDAAKLTGGGPVQHPPFAKGDCASCHDPHAGGAAKLTRAPGNALCVRCHAQRAEAVGVPHKAVTAGGLRVLPPPHAAKEKGLAQRRGRGALREVPREDDGGRAKKKVMHRPSPRACARAATTRTARTRRAC